ncbi:uncharacterized protein EI90DRAFT_3022213 [Cantharellus anzutake]|uniref:uncharacterized protein n=1 Tax=Cantharellus anzutake TaxID=1750568 RepID=UPI00190837C2|nr:uncharacterized protein EI90DRAFT_3022213 [Cantharellus anzutake]KAF8314603.1 hypothetical protein EI90DRAFT_3022213 [Cantharellus anzutake]
MTCLLSHLILNLPADGSQLLECALDGYPMLTHLRTYETASEPLAAHNDLILFATTTQPEMLALARMDGATWTISSKVDDAVPQRVQAGFFTESHIVVFKYSVICIYGLDTFNKSSVYISPQLFINPKQVIDLEGGGYALFQVQPWVRGESGHSIIQLIARSGDNFLLCPLSTDDDTGLMTLDCSYAQMRYRSNVRWPWVRNLALTSSNSSCVFFSGNASPQNPRIVVCSIKEGQLGEPRTLWELPGPDCWDNGLYLSLDDVLGVMVVGTSQGNVWLVDLGLSGENSVFVNGKANIPRELQKNPIAALHSYLDLPTDRFPFPPRFNIRALRFDSQNVHILCIKVPETTCTNSNMVDILRKSPSTPKSGCCHVRWARGVAQSTKDPNPAASDHMMWTCRRLAGVTAHGLLEARWLGSHVDHGFNPNVKGCNGNTLKGSPEWCYFALDPIHVRWLPGNWTISSFLSELGQDHPPMLYSIGFDYDEYQFQEHFKKRYAVGREVGAIDTFGYGYDTEFHNVAEQFFVIFSHYNSPISILQRALKGHVIVFPAKPETLETQMNVEHFDMLNTTMGFDDFQSSPLVSLIKHQDQGMVYVHMFLIIRLWSGHGNACTESKVGIYRAQRRAWSLRVHLPPMKEIVALPLRGYHFRKKGYY